MLVAAELIPNVSQMADTGASCYTAGMITPRQARAARAGLRLSATRLAELAGVGVASIKRLEAAEDLPRMNVATLAKIRRALEALGVEFVGEDTVKFTAKTPPAKTPRRRA